MKRLVAILMLVFVMGVAIPLTSYSQEEGGAPQTEEKKEKAESEKAEKGD
ncbi:MAG: hypothetical protein Q8P24_19325 [Desulfobacterales bacterium]|nr:hypothetical protein [Desulfobacterales bacterium]